MSCDKGNIFVMICSLQSFWLFVEPMVSDEIKQKLRESLKDASNVRKSRVGGPSMYHVFQVAYIRVFPSHPQGMGEVVSYTGRNDLLP